MCFCACVINPLNLVFVFYSNDSSTMSRRKAFITNLTRKANNTRSIPKSTCQCIKIPSNDGYVNYEYALCYTCNLMTFLSAAARVLINFKRDSSAYALELWLQVLDVNEVITAMSCLDLGNSETLVEYAIGRST